MGLWQAVALIPGTSRSGITITAARQLGYARTDAAKLAMLMSIPTILASGALLGAEVAANADAGAARDGAIAAAFAFGATRILLLVGPNRVLAVDISRRASTQRAASSPSVMPPDAGLNNGTRRAGKPSADVTSIHR